MKPLLITGLSLVLCACSLDKNDIDKDVALCKEHSGVPSYKQAGPAPGVIVWVNCKMGNLVYRIDRSGQFREGRVVE